MPSLTTFTSFSQYKCVNIDRGENLAKYTTISIKLEHFVKAKSGSFYKVFRTLVDDDDNKNV